MNSLYLATMVFCNCLSAVIQLSFSLDGILIVMYCQVIDKHTQENYYAASQFISTRREQFRPFKILIFLYFAGCTKFSTISGFTMHSVGYFVWKKEPYGRQYINQEVSGPSLLKMFKISRKKVM
jgi:hypothetical protein